MSANLPAWKNDTTTVRAFDGHKPVPAEIRKTHFLSTEIRHLSLTLDKFLHTRLLNVPMTAGRLLNACMSRQ